MRNYKTKAVRKAERWARRGVLTGTVKKFRDHLWFQQLVETHGVIHAVRMTHDAMNAASWSPSRGTGRGGVVIWHETNYCKDWCQGADW